MKNKYLKSFTIKAVLICPKCNSDVEYIMNPKITDTIDEFDKRELSSIFHTEEEHNSEEFTEEHVITCNCGCTFCYNIYQSEFMINNIPEDYYIRTKL